MEEELFELRVQNESLKEQIRICLEANKRYIATISDLTGEVLELYMKLNFTEENAP